MTECPRVECNFTWSKMKSAWNFAETALPPQGQLESIAFRNVFMYDTYQKANMICGDIDLPFLKLTPRQDKICLNE